MSLLRSIATYRADSLIYFFTFRVSRSRVCVCVSVGACPHYCTDPDVTWVNRRGCLLVMHHWADLHSMHGFRCHYNIIIIIIIIINDNVYGAVIVTMVTARVHPVHLMNAD